MSREQSPLAGVSGAKMPSFSEDWINAGENGWTRVVLRGYPRGPEVHLLGVGGGPDRRRLCGDISKGEENEGRNRTSPKVVGSPTGYILLLLSFPALILKSSLQEC